MKLGVFEGLFPAGLDLATCFKHAAAAGFEGVELSLVNHEPLLAEARNEATEGIIAIEHSIGLDKPRPDGLHLDSTPADIEKLKATASDAGIVIPSVSTMQIFHYPLSSPIPKVREHALCIARKMLESTAMLGGDLILVNPGMVTADVPYQEVWERSHESLTTLLPYAAELGVTIGIENVWNRFLLSPLEFRDYIDSFYSPFIGAYFDVANVLRYGFPDHWIETLGSRVKRVHFKDYRLDVDNILGFVPLLHGDVPWTRVVKSLKRIGYDGWVIVEVTPYREYPMQALRDAAAAVGGILAEK
ncbi:MAG: sugar phosphate isomerase/epimerase family protein [Anaerolineae bacterium]